MGIAYYLLNTSLSLGLFFHPEEGSSISFEPSIDFQRTVRCYIPEYRSLHDHRYENTKSLIRDEVHFKTEGGSVSRVPADIRLGIFIQTVRNPEVQNFSITQ